MSEGELYDFSHIELTTCRVYKIELPIAYIKIVMHVLNI